MSTKDVMMLVRMPPELKELFQTLCKSRGVSVSAEVRRFIADEISGVATGMTSQDVPKKVAQSKKVAQPRKIISSSEKGQELSRCEKTGDLFASETTEKAAIAAFNQAQASKVQNDSKALTQGKIQPSSAAKSAMNASNSRKKPKSRKK